MLRLCRDKSGRRQLPLRQGNRCGELLLPDPGVRVPRQVRRDAALSANNVRQAGQLPRRREVRLALEHPRRGQHSNALSPHLSTLQISI